jgi:hypothetical protein
LEASSLAVSSVPAAVPPVSEGEVVPVDSLGVEEPSAPWALDFVLEDVEVDLLAWRSAEVSFGGVISGVLLGTVFDTLLPPQAARPRGLTHSIAASASAAARGERFGRRPGGEVTSPAGPSCGHT